MAEQAQDLDLNTFFEGLGKTLQDALTGGEAQKSEKKKDEKPEGEQPALVKAVETLTSRVGAIEQSLTGDSELSFKSIMLALHKEITDGREALSKTLDRVGLLEGRTSVSKSVQGDDKGDGDETKVEKGGDSPLGAAVRKMALQSRRGGSAELTLT